jgi:hypothetical protein
MKDVEIIEQFRQIDWWYVFIGIVIFLILIKLLWSLFDWFVFDKLGIETRKMKQRREEREQLKTVSSLAKTTAENLDKLQKKHLKDEEEFRNNLNNYMEESRKDRRALHDEMTKFTNDRISDRKQSLEIQKELKDSMKDLIDGQHDRDEKLESLTKMFIDKEIDDMRWEILNFCSALSNGRTYNREAFDHVLKVYDKYETILEENNMENGLVEQSIKFVREVYFEGLKDGTIN